MMSARTIAFVSLQILKVLNVLTVCYPGRMKKVWSSLRLVITSLTLNTGEPWLTYDYIPLVHRLRLQYSDPDQARKLTAYRAEVDTRTQSTGVLEDFWGSKLDIRLREMGLFQNDTDLGFYLSTDGIKVYKSRVEFHNWPILLVNLNLPPAKRYKRKYCLFVGSIPGPFGPKDLNSFLVPLIDELRELQEDIPGIWNAYKKEYFTLKAHICVVGSDIPAHESLMQLTG